MSRRFIGVLFVTLWFVLLGVEFAEDMGLIEYDETEMDRCVEAALTSLGEAIKISDDLQLAAPGFLAVSPADYFSPLESREVLSSLIGERTRLVKIDIPIYSLHQVFLI